MIILIIIMTAATELIIIIIAVITTGTTVTATNHYYYYYYHLNVFSTRYSWWQTCSLPTSRESTTSYMAQRWKWREFQPGLFYSKIFVSVLLLLYFMT